jgi:hypothetical protein
LKIEDLYLSIDKQSADGYDAANEYTDVIVQLDNGQKYIASFFSYGSIEKLRCEHEQTGEFLGGKYFRADGMVLVKECTKEIVKEVVEDLMEEGPLDQIFQRITE